MQGLSFVVLGVAVAVAVFASGAQAQGAEKRRTGNTCNTDVECPDNAFCKAGSYCVCKDGYIFAATEPSSKACLKVGNYGEDCGIDVQCHSVMGVHAACTQGKCACQNGTQLVGERCYLISAVGDRCRVDNNCYIKGALPEEQSYCVRGQCMCLLNYRARDNGTRCVRDAVLGDKCEDHEQCAGSGLICKGTCRCREGYTALNESNICVETITTLGAACEFDIQCETLAGVRDARPTGSVLCLSSKCACGFNARVAGNPPRCWSIRRPGQQCRRDEECLSEEDEPGFCRSGRCTCHGCTPDASDFADGSGALTSVPLVSAILAITAILA